MNGEFETDIKYQNIHETSNLSQSRSPWIGSALRLSLFAIVLVFCMSFVGKKHDAEYSKKFWDKLLGGIAWLTDREYDPNAATLTDQLTLRKKNRH